MLKYDGILFGISTSYGNSTASDWRAFWDKTGGIWFSRGLFHKAAGVFASSGTQGSGPENIFTTAITTFAHQGMSYIPFGYNHSSGLLDDMREVHGGTPWGAGTFSVSLPLILVLLGFAIDQVLMLQGTDGLREPSDVELRIAEAQGQDFYEAFCKLDTFNFSKDSSA